MKKDIEFIMNDIRRHEEKLEDDKKRLKDKMEDMGKEAMQMESVIGEAQSIIRAATAIDKSTEALRTKKQLMQFLHEKEI